MSTTVHLGGRRVRLADEDLLGVGGEGKVYRSGDRAIKVFFAPDEARQKKLAAFPRDLPSSVIGPTELCTDDAGHVVGFAMRALDDAVDIHRLGQRKWREAHGAGLDVLGVFRDLDRTVGALHARGIVVGDLNDGNVVLTRSTVTRGWSPFFIDADSMQLPGFPCVVAHERFLDPRLYGVDLSRRAALSRESDFYALAVMLFTSLLYLHPFGGAHASYPTMLRRAEARHSVLRGDVKLPHAAQNPEVLPDDALDWFLEVFERDLRAPLPPAILDARFTRCASCGATHARRTCPACALRVPAAAPVVTRGRLRATRLPELPSHARPSLVSPGGALVALDGEWLVRPADGTRVGQILEGQTHVRAGAEVGFAFYRASAMTMYFVFDPRRGPLRQIELPPIEGRLVDWSAAFDAGHVLFSTVTEKGGKVTHAAHLVAATGEVLASESGPPGSSAMLGGAGVSGRCLAGGSVLVATDDGLVLVRADRAARAFVPVRAFPETRDLVPPDADLLVGPGGSVYVVSHDVVVHLCFEGQP